nr:fasciclin [Shiraia sp. slf14]
MRTSTLIALALPALSSAAALSLEKLLSKHPKLSTFHDLLTQFDLLDDFKGYDNITIVAPTNQAYLDLANWGFNVSEVPAPVARALLTYHVLQGEHTLDSLSSQQQVVHTYLKPPVLTNVTDGAAVKLSRDNSGKIITQSGLGVYGSVEEADIAFTHGVLHTLNSSMVLPHNITLTAEINGLTKFLDLMSEAGLVEEFEALKDVTVFIPQNAALEKLLWLMKLLPKENLASVLKYHVVPNKVLYEAAVEDEEDHETLDGGVVRLSSGRSGDLRVNGVKVLHFMYIKY